LTLVSITAMRQFLPTFLVILTLTSCDKNLPGGFWKNFKSDLIKHKESDQGPYGGTRSIFWSTSEQGTFTEKKVLDFATANGWEPVNSTHFSKQDMTDWYHDQTPVFPIYFDGTNEVYSDNNPVAYTAFERWINKDLTVYRFKTSWLLIYPGTDESTQENAYILISEDGMQMTLYNIWGE